MRQIGTVEFDASLGLDVSCEIHLSCHAGYTDGVECSRRSPLAIGYTGQQVFL